MINQLLPRRLDNTYGGRTAGLWLFAVVVAVKALQSVSTIVDAHNIVRSADGIPLESFPAAASQVVVALFALNAVSRLMIGAMAFLVLIRYRSAIPLMFTLLAADYVCRQLALWLYPIYRIGEPVGPIVNMALFGLTLVGLGLSLWTRRDRRADL